MLARAVMAIPPLRAAVRWLAGIPPRTAKQHRTFEQTIGDLAAELVARDGISAISALAAAEATLLRGGNMRFDRIEYNEDLIEWFGIYETGPARRPTMVKVPLAHATEAHRMGNAEALLN